MNSIIGTWIFLSIIIVGIAYLIILKAVRAFQSEKKAKVYRTEIQSGDPVYFATFSGTHDGEVIETVDDDVYIKVKVKKHLIYKDYEK